MQVSIGKLATTLVALLITVTVVTTAVGLHILHNNFRSLEQRHDAEAHDTVHNAAVAIGNQVRFYQGMLQLVAANPEVGNLLEFGETTDMVNWSGTLGRLLPGTLGTALASPQGKVFGDPLALRVGSACSADMRNFAAGLPLDYPPLHTDVAGLEHFDLLTRIDNPSGETIGTLFVSFRLSVLSDLLTGMANPGDHYVLVDQSGRGRLESGTPPVRQETSAYRATVPETAWELTLHRLLPARSTFISDLVIADSAIVIAVAILMVSLVRATHGRFAEDMRRIHQALTDVLEGRYQPSSERPAIKEMGILLSDIERLALNIQHQSLELRQQSLSDPLTGVFNRRYFDLMLAHLHEQSRRQAAGVLVIVDLNDFKTINDRFGHASGDRVLQHTADYLRARVRASDIVARLGGDEFALILSHMAPDKLEDWLATLVAGYAGRQVLHDGGMIDVCQFSAGAATLDAAAYPHPADVFDAADSAMYAVKSNPVVAHSRYAIARPGNVTPLNPARDAR